MPFEKDSGQKWRARLRRLVRPRWLGLWGGTKPLSYHWGTERGTPVDRYYIERFLAAHGDDIRGHVLEVAEDSYTRRFGSRVEQSDVVDVNRANARATLFADLTQSGSIPADTYDCFILTQTLHFIYDFQAALRNARRLLRAGGVLLATVPVVSKDCSEAHSDYWRFTPHACRQLFGDVFGGDNVEVESYGSVLTAAAFLYGVAQEELTAQELEARDPVFPLVVCVRALKR